MARYGVVRLCDIEGCPRAYSTRGWCRTHYQRWLAYGDAEASRCSVGSRIADVLAARYPDRVVEHGTWARLACEFGVSRQYVNVIANQRGYSVRKLRKNNAPA